MTTFDTICREAARLFATKGVEAISMRDVADACGITVAALYYHFSSKEDLYEEVGRVQFEQFMNQLRSARAALPAREQTPSQLVAIVFDVVLNDPTLFLLTQRELHRGDRSERQVQARTRFIEAEAFLRQTMEGHAQREIDEHDVFALACIVTGYCEYVHADARTYGPDREAFIAGQREGLIRVVQRAFEARR